MEKIQTKEKRNKNSGENGEKSFLNSFLEF